MPIIPATVLVLASLALVPLDPIGSLGDKPKEPARTIEITRQAHKVVFTEKGKPASKAVAVVVGQSVRWVNCDDQPWTIRSIVEVNGKSLFRTEVIPPGGHKDILFNNTIYRAAGGQTAESVSLKYQANDQVDATGELILLSPARR